MIDQLRGIIKRDVSIFHEKKYQNKTIEIAFSPEEKLNITCVPREITLPVCFLGSNIAGKIISKVVKDLKILHYFITEKEDTKPFFLGGVYSSENRRIKQVMGVVSEGNILAFDENQLEKFISPEKISNLKKLLEEKGFSLD